MDKKRNESNRSFGNVAETIAGIDPKQIVKLKAPKKMSKRVEELINLKKENALTFEEHLELEPYLALDLFISLAKAQARVLLAS